MPTDKEIREREKKLLAAQLKIKAQIQDLDKKRKRREITDRILPRALAKLEAGMSVAEIAIDLGVGRYPLAAYLREYAQKLFDEGINAGKSANEMREELRVMGLRRGKPRTVTMTDLEAINAVRETTLPKAAEQLGVSSAYLSLKLDAAGMPVRKMRLDHPLTGAARSGWYKLDGSAIKAGAWRKAVRHARKAS